MITKRFDKRKATWRNLIVGTAAPIPHQQLFSQTRRPRRHPKGSPFPPPASDPSHPALTPEPQPRSEPQICSSVRWKFRTISITFSFSLPAIWAQGHPFLSLRFEPLTLRSMTDSEDQFQALTGATSLHHCEFTLPSFSQWNPNFLSTGTISDGNANLRLGFGTL